MVILSSPNNPTGGVIPPDEYQQILAVCKKRNVWLMSDECYSHFTYDPHKPYSIASVADSKEHVVIIGSMFENFCHEPDGASATRLPPEALVQATVKLQSQSTPIPRPSPARRAGSHARLHGFRSRHARRIRPPPSPHR